MGSIVSAYCPCGYETELFDGCGMAGPQSCQQIAACESCHHVMSLSENNTNQCCERCGSRQLEMLEFDEEFDAVIEGLVCPKCGQPTLRLEQGGFWD